MIVSKKEKNFRIFSNHFEQYLKNCHHEPKNLKGDHRNKGATTGKIFFPNMSLTVQNDCFDEKKTFLMVLKQFQAW